MIKAAKSAALILVIAGILYILAACTNQTDGTDVHSLRQEQPSSLEAPALQIEESSTSEAPAASQTNPLLTKVEWVEYDGYDMGGEEYPTADEMASYLDSILAFHGAAAVGEPELWEYVKDTHSSKEYGGIPVHQLIARRAVLQDGLTECYFGAARWDGSAYTWPVGGQEPVMEPAEGPDVFPTELRALEYVKSIDPYAALHELGHNYTERESPFYQSQTTSGDLYPSSVHHIEIEQSGDAGYVIRSYEVVMDSPDEGHTATILWVQVYKNGLIRNLLSENRWIVVDPAQ